MMALSGNEEKSDQHFVVEEKHLNKNASFLFILNIK